MTDITANFTQTSINASFTGSVSSGGELTDHNDLQNIQGGTTDEYYHLTNSEHGKISSIDVSITGSNCMPSYGINGTDPQSVDIGACNMWAVYTNGSNDIVKENFELDAQTYTPLYTGGTSQQITYIAMYYDNTLNGGLGGIGIIERNYYRDFTDQEAYNIGAYFPTTRDTATGNITVVSVKYLMGSRGVGAGDKPSLLKGGSQKLRGDSYKLTLETNPPATGSYLAIATGLARTAGRNRANDYNQTYDIFDTARAGGETGYSIAIAGRGTIGNEGQQFFRVFGSDARILSGQSVIYEPTPADVDTDYVAVAVTKWTCFKFLIFPGSKLVIMCPSASGSYVSAVTAIEDSHIYDTPSLLAYDRWIPCLHVGYFVCRGDFDSTASWASNAGKYAFYDADKVQYTP